jgi:hypothetical protein
MESLQNLLNEVDVNQGLARLAIASGFALAIACGAFLCLIGYFALARRDIALPTVLWLLAVFLACVAVQHLAEMVLDQSPSGLPGHLQILNAVVAWFLFFATTKSIPTLSRLGVLSKLNHDLQREADQLRVAHTSLQQRLTELERINAELEYVSRGVVGREERILELKREINQLLQRLGEQPRYRAAMDLQV